jgi:membrane-bound lytic murein transglycosylase D
MPEVKDFFPFPSFARRILTVTLPVALAVSLLAGCATQSQHSAELTLTDQELQSLTQDAAIDEQALIALSDNDSETLAEESTDADNETALVTLLNPELTEPDAEHNTLDSDGNSIKDTADQSENIDTLAISTLALAPQNDYSNQEINDLWDRIRNRFILEDSNHKRTLSEKKWYASHQAYLDRTIERAQPYLHLIVEEAERLNVPAELVLLPIVESAFQPFAYSHGRAAGIWQFIPNTGRIFGLKQNWWYDGRRDIDASTRAALKYLSNLSESFDGDWLLALAAYNSGQGTVKKAINRNRRLGKDTDFWSLRLPKETRAYVPKLLAISAIIKNPDLYGISLTSVPNTPYLAKVDTNTQIDLALAAELADVSLEDLYRLNPAFNRWATAPEGPHNLLLPVDKAENFNRKLAELPTSERIKWARHKIKDGETLGQIANQYHTTVNMLRQVNKLNGHMIRAGKSLIIPVATKKMNNYTLSAMQRTQTIQNTPKHGNKTRYTVHKGDSLWNIAQQYRISVNTLAKWNGMAPRDILRQGQQLVIWDKTQNNASEAQNSLRDNATTQRINYIVRNGDSLARISQRFNVKLSELRRWNGLHKDKYLQPGQRLTLYIDVTRQSENS